MVQRRIDSFPRHRYDYVIVGAGSAGCVLANQLTADPTTSVLLLEAGPTDRKTEIGIPAAFPKLFKTDYDWDYTTTPQPELAQRSLYWPRGRTLGGSSAINAQMYARGNALDYGACAARGNTGWSWADVLPAFRRSECNARGASEFVRQRAETIYHPVGTCRMGPDPTSSVVIAERAAELTGQSDRHTRV